MGKGEGILYKGENPEVTLWKGRGWRAVMEMSKDREKRRNNVIEKGEDRRYGDEGVKKEKEKNRKKRRSDVM